MKRIFKNETVQEFFESKEAVFGLVLIIVLTLAAIFANFIAPQNPYDLKELNLQNAYKPPGYVANGIRFLLGTDDQGRGVFSTILYGMRISLFVGVVSTVFSAIIGTILGLIAGYFGGKVDMLIMRLADIQLSFPALLIALMIMAIWGQGLDKIIIAITVVGWVYYARTVRGSTLAEREKEYVDSARVVGVGHLGIMFKHILPNVLAPVIVIGTVRIANAIILEATLSFLGLGVPVTKPSLGSMIASGYQVLFSGYWWVSVFPGIALMLIVMGINLVGDRLRDILNPKLKR